MARCPCDWYTIFVKENVFIAVHNFDAPVFTVEREQVLWRSFFRRQTCNQIDNFLFDGLPRAFLFAWINRRTRQTCLTVPHAS